jgi:hypothetical protein
MPRCKDYPGSQILDLENVLNGLNEFHALQFNCGSLNCFDCCLCRLAESVGMNLKLPGKGTLAEYLHKCVFVDQPCCQQSLEVDVVSISFVARASSVLRLIAL